MSFIVRIIWFLVLGLVVAGGIYVATQKIPAPVSEVRKPIAIDPERLKGR